MTAEDSLKAFVKEVFGDKAYFGLKAPNVSAEQMAESRKICANNLCGNYNTSWTCPPHTGDIDKCVQKVESYENAIVMYESFQVESMDMEHLGCKIGEMQDLCRKVLVKVKDTGLDVFVLCGGPCNYCEECSVKSGIDCVNPEMSIPSVSGYGIKINDLLKEKGHEPVFTENLVELYGLILY